MPSKIITKPRKKPLQARSSETVNVILDATARVLCREGYDRASTNRIAEAAGVSIGSLYQYFPSKEALVAALIDRHREEAMGIFFARLSEIATDPLPVGTRKIVQAMVDLHAVDPVLHSILSEQVPRVGRLNSLMEDIEVHAAKAVRTLLDVRKDELRVTDLDAAVFVIVHSVEAVTHRGGRHYQKELSTERLVNEVTDLVVRYLCKEPRALRTQPSRTAAS
jgi:AcrR family transcriptional regulator